jgi:hypothetical protein
MISGGTESVCESWRLYPSSSDRRPCGAAPTRRLRWRPTGRSSAEARTCADCADAAKSRHYGVTVVSRLLPSLV